jgi:hypothetical protein
MKKHEDNFERSVIFVDTGDYLDTISLEPGLVSSADKFFALFEEITQARAF